MRYKIQEILDQRKNNKQEQDMLPRIRHVLMREYGYIPQKEWEEMYLTVIWQLLEQIREDQKMVEKKMSKGRKK